MGLCGPMSSGSSIHERVVNPKAHAVQPPCKVALLSRPSAPPHLHW